MDNTYSIDPGISSTLSQFITAGRGITLKYSNFCFLQKDDNGNTISIYNVLDDYMDELDQYILDVPLTEMEVMKYRFNPKKLAYDLYGSTELFAFILYINRIGSIKDFSLTKRKVKLINKQYFTTIFGEILSAEKADLKMYNSKNT